MAIIGIDLGTTNSLGCVYKDGRVKLIPNRFGSYLTPSVVSVGEDGKMMVGQLAKERLITHPECTAASFKKDMGTEKKWNLGGQEFSPEELSSMVIRSILDDAREYLGEEIEEAVISVPAYFHDEQRVATRRAGLLAGVKVERITNEPSAAALASYFDTSKEQCFLIFDFGGGTLDVSVVECFGTVVEILSVAGDNRLGGDDFDTLMADQFLLEHGLSRNDISGQEYAALRRQAEQCKINLGRKEKAVLHAVIGGVSYRSIYTMERLLAESELILGKIRQVVGRALKDGELTIQDIDEVVMAGGSSKMPLIQSYVRHLFRRHPIVQDNCDQLIALGLGVVCGVKQRKDEVKDYVLTDICPFSLGTAIVNPSDPNHSYMSVIIERNTVLPCSRMRRFYSAQESQEYVNIEVLQGEHTYAKDNLLLGKMKVDIPSTTGKNEAVDVRFTYDINGILIVDSTVVSTGEMSTSVISQKVSDQELEQRVKELEKLKVHPREITANQVMLERLKALYEEVYPEQREAVQSLIRNFEQILERQDDRKIAKYRKYLNDIIGQIVTYDPFEREFAMPGGDSGEWGNDTWMKDSGSGTEEKEKGEEQEDDPEKIWMMDEGGFGGWTS